MMVIGLEDVILVMVEVKILVDVQACHHCLCQFWTMINSITYLYRVFTECSTVLHRASVLCDVG